MELPYDSIGFGAGTLAISFKAGDIAALEKSFRDAGQNNLEVIKQCDAEGHVQPPKSLLRGANEKRICN